MISFSVDGFGMPLLSKIKEGNSIYVNIQMHCCLFFSGKAHLVKQAHQLSAPLTSFFYCLEVFLNCLKRFVYLVSQQKDD